MEGRFVHFNFSVLPIEVLEFVYLGENFEFGKCRARTISVRYIIMESS